MNLPSVPSMFWVLSSSKVVQIPNGYKPQYVPEACEENHLYALLQIFLSSMDSSE